MTREEAVAINTATQAMGLGLAGMTWERWIALSIAERMRLVDNSGLTKQLKGYERCRVEVITKAGERRRFWVGVSSGWRPCHLEIKRQGSGGTPAEHEYQSVMIVRNSSGEWIR